ncbi:MAG: GNAT family N-acetyltransferase [Trueperaceae bacterium]|nr:GNAT family N-acetyltransferase [Trueperaceae bacterium]
MAHYSSDVRIVVCASADLVAGHEFDAELDLFRRPALQRAALAEIAEDPESCVSVALTTGEPTKVVGYAAFHAQAQQAAGSSRVLELGALEVAPAYRRRGIASSLLKSSFAGGRFDAAVVFARLYAWHYDLGRTGLGPLAYRRFLKRLYGGSGLEVVTTRQGGDGAPAVHGADLIMARFGPDADALSVESFKIALGVRRSTT